MRALNKLPNAQLPADANLYRGFSRRLEEMNDLYTVGSDMWWHYTSSSSRHLKVAYTDFSRGSGTLMALNAVSNAKDIRALSMFPSEAELVIMHNTRFRVEVTLSCAQARLFSSAFSGIPDNVDLVILKAM
jgi:hypothetical protein